MTGHEALRLATVLAAGEVAMDLGGETALNWVAVHEAGHAVVWLALGADPEKIRIDIEAGKGGVVTYPVRDDDDVVVPAEIPPDDTKFDRLSAGLVGCGHAPLDRAAVNREAAAILRERWDLVITIASHLTQRLTVSEKVRMDGVELNWLYYFHQRRKGLAEALQAQGNSGGALDELPGQQPDITSQNLTNEKEHDNVFYEID